MSFRATWAERAVGRLQGYVRDNPGLVAGLRYSVETLDLELTDRADTWGESRAGAHRLGYVGMLWALVRVDPDRRTVRIVDLKLEHRPRAG